MGQLTMLIVPGATALPELYVPLMDSVQEGPPPTMYDDAAFIAAQVKSLADAGNDVILITHSYGGVPATQSVQGLSKKEREAQGLESGVVRIAYITSLVAEVGNTAAGVQAPLPEESKVPAVVDDNGWFSYSDIPKVAALSFSDMPLKEGEYWAKKLVHHSGPSFVSPLTYPGFKDVPVSYLLCLNDLTILLEIQQSGIDMIERETGRKVAVTRIEADHVAPLSHTDKVAKWVLQLANKA
ncbi:alpha/beta-hydrolase [Hypoxylon sp. FL1284]|nr:alpha/beta-hydrolase [Hypoxylon sp. FL1284]